jgi:Holliday junction DNA helicase RuvA
MIASLRGKILRLEISHVYLETNSGVGYEIQIPFPTHLGLKDLPKDAEILLHIHHSITDRAQKLFGFLNPKDRELFRLMKGLNGIGEQTAIKILSFLDGESLYKIALEDKKEVLEKIPKVKGKTSEKVLFELKQNLKKLETFISEESGSREVSDPQDKEKDLAILGLIQLGLDEKSARKEVDLLWKSGMTSASHIIGDILKRMK